MYLFFLIFRFTVFAFDHLIKSAHAILLRLNRWAFVVTQAHFALEELYSENTEDQEEEQNDQQYVKKRWDGENEGINDSLDAYIL